MKFIRSAVEEIIGSYKGGTPLVHYLKQFFKARPKLGSRDRRAIADGVYAFYRVAKFVDGPEQKVWNIIHWALQNEVTSNEQLKRTCDAVQPTAIAPVFDISTLNGQFSDDIEAEDWYQGSLNVPDTFIRLRVAPFNIIPILKAKGLEYELIDETAIAFPNGYKLSDALPEQFYVVQDLASQKSLDAFFALAPFKAEDSFSIWDTCSGAGGKMLLLKDRYPKASILCTDIRPAILHNLRARAKLYYHKNVKTQILDSSDHNAVNNLKERFDCVISDVPCSGSGTWARTPEQFYFFDINQIQKFQELQSDIAKNAATKVKPGGYFIYITCSVFRSENEVVVGNIMQEHAHLTLLHQGAINGINAGADSMFVAVMQAAE